MHKQKTEQKTEVDKGKINVIGKRNGERQRKKKEEEKKRKRTEERRGHKRGNIYHTGNRKITRKRKGKRTTDSRRGKEKEKET